MSALAAARGGAPPGGWGLRWLAQAATWTLATSACAPAPADESVIPAEGALPLDFGRNVFLESAEPSCALCHTLAEAGSTGAIGPDLDALRPDVQAIVSAVRDGVGVMPAQSEHLTEEEIQAVARYVFEATSGPD